MQLASYSGYHCLVAKTAPKWNGTAVVGDPPSFKEIKSSDYKGVSACASLIIFLIQLYFREVSGIFLLSFGFVSFHNMIIYNGLPHVHANMMFLFTIYRKSEYFR